MAEYLGIEALIGKTLTKADNRADEEIIFETTDGEVYRLCHSQACCESVNVEDIVGDLNDLLGSPILRAEERSGSNDGSHPNSGESYTWTFYELATVKGTVTIRWLGESNGYYSEDVDFVRDIA